MTIYPKDRIMETMLQEREMLYCPELELSEPEKQTFNTREAGRIIRDRTTQP
jgi:hypothetical protein